MKRLLLSPLTLLLAFAAQIATAQQVLPPADIPTAGYVPDALTAQRIAVAVWQPLYGHLMKRHHACSVVLVADSAWAVRSGKQPSAKGGGPYMLINKRDGRILEVSYQK